MRACSLYAQQTSELRISDDPLLQAGHETHFQAPEATYVGHTPSGEATQAEIHVEPVEVLTDAETDGNVVATISNIAHV